MRGGRLDGAPEVSIFLELAPFVQTGGPVGKASRERVRFRRDAVAPNWIDFALDPRVSGCVSCGPSDPCRVIHLRSFPTRLLASLFEMCADGSVTDVD